MLVGNNGKSTINSENFLFEIACQPRAVIKVRIKKPINRQLTWNRCSNFTIRRTSKEAKFD
jgi:hypothetical protein